MYLAPSVFLVEEGKDLLSDLLLGSLVAENVG
jgi:hypothetical protein